MATASHRRKAVNPPLRLHPRVPVASSTAMSFAVVPQSAPTSINHSSTEESEVPLRSHGSLSLNRALMAVGLVDHVQLTLFPVITGQTGLDPIFQGAADLELVENRTLDDHTQELIHRPTLH
jgi:dihydrofolate reductase